MIKYNLNIPGWTTEKELYILGAFAELVPENGSILEIGCGLGRSTYALYSNKKPSVNLDVVDNFRVANPHKLINMPFENTRLAPCDMDLWNNAKAIIVEKGWQEGFKFCIGDEIYNDINVHAVNSKDFVKEKKYNLTYIDGDHSFETVLSDIIKFISVDDLLIGDDLHKLFPGVAAALSQTRGTRTLIAFEDTKTWALIPKTGYWRDVFKNNNLLFL